MKKVTRATLGLLLASSGLSTAEGTELLPESRRVRSAYVALTANPGDGDMQSAYLEAFPGDARTFSAVFASEHAPLRDLGAYIAPLGTIGRNLPAPTFEKILRIETAAGWEPGGLDDLQSVTLRLALADPKGFAGAFAGLRAGEQRAVAAFLADGADGPREEVLGLAAKLEAIGHRAPAKALRDEITLSEARGDRA